MTAKETIDKLMPLSRNSLLALLAVIVTAFSVFRISQSYSVLCQTDDEPGHLATGMQMLDRGKYTIETLHPPLGRVSTAFFPYFFDGARSNDEPDQYVNGSKILLGQGHYWKTLTLERLGMIPWYLLSVFVVWSWSKKMFGIEVAFLAVLFFTLLPTILGNAGVATTDYPLTCGFLASSYAFWWWIQKTFGMPSEPSWKRSAILGVVIGLSVATKFSFLVFFPVAAAVILIYELFVKRKTRLDAAFLRMIVPQLVLALFFAFIAVWACYRFSFGPLPHTVGASYPMPEFFDGLRSISNQNHSGHALYFMGKQQHDHGSIWYFPVGIALKTPIAFLLLAVAGSALIFLHKNSWKTREFLKSRELLPLLISAAMLAVVMPSDINVGVRHILPIYAFLAMLAALGARWLFTLPKIYGVTAFAVLLTWMFASSVSADPDDLSYFNELAGSKPEYYMIAADLDWGQDGQRLIDTMRARGVPLMDIIYHGSANLTALGLPPGEPLYVNSAPRTNWVVISKLLLYCNDGYAWLQHETPEITIGKTILVYHFSDSELAVLRSGLPGSNSSVTGDEIARSEELANQAPSPENFLNLSIAYYYAKRYNDCVAAAHKSIELKPDYPEAYNNLAAGFLQMSQWDSAIAAAKEAIRLKPDLQLAKNNLAAGIEGKKSHEGNLQKLENTDEQTPENYIAQSVTFYQASEYEKSIAAARKALALRPEYAEAYINICAAENVLGNYEEARKAGEEAVRLQPDNQLARNNLQWSLDNLKKK
jgi:Flp pilus assembly protein TadD